jgi:alkylation response protein AidB-like acyl-CoA dehydrogenase
MAKLFCGEVAEAVLPRLIQLTGSHGCYRDQPYERYWRDAKSLSIAGGTLEVMRNTIAAQLLKTL